MRYIVLLLTCLIAKISLAQVCLVRTEKCRLDIVEKIGTGFFVGERQVLSCFHIVDQYLLPDPPRIRIEYKDRLYRAKVIKHHKAYDLSLIETESKFKNTFSLAEQEPKVDDRLRVRGYLYGQWRPHSNYGPLHAIRNWVRQDQSRLRKYTICTQVDVGMSGGPVLNAANEVVGVIIEKNKELNKTYASTLGQIKEFLNERSK